MFHYDVIVRTGDVWNGGTSGVVSITVYGERGDSGLRTLTKPVQNGQIPFGKGQINVFSIESVSLGTIRRIKLQHEPAGDAMGWFAESVIVHDKNMNSDYLFPIYRWLNPLEDDRSLVAELRPVDAGSQLQVQDKNLVSLIFRRSFHEFVSLFQWKYFKWRFSMPSAELVFFSTVSHKALRM